MSGNARALDRRRGRSCSLNPTPCADTRRRAQGLMDADEAEGLDAHFADCAACQEAVEMELTKLLDAAKSSEESE